MYRRYAHASITPIEYMCIGLIRALSSKTFAFLNFWWGHWWGTWEMGIVTVLSWRLVDLVGAEVEDYFVRGNVVLIRWTNSRPVHVPVYRYDQPENAGTISRPEARTNQGWSVDSQHLADIVSGTQKKYGPYKNSRPTQKESAQRKRIVQLPW